jgi:hypothetical protein
MKRIAAWRAAPDPHYHDEVAIAAAVRIASGILAL